MKNVGILRESFGRELTPPLSCGTNAVQAPREESDWFGPGARRAAFGSQRSSRQTPAAVKRQTTTRATAPSCRRVPRRWTACPR